MINQIQEINTTNGPVTVTLPKIYENDCVAAAGDGRLMFIPAESIEVWLPLVGDHTIYTILNAPANGLAVYPTDTKLDAGQTAVFRAERFTEDEDGEPLDPPCLIWYFSHFVDGDDGSTEDAP